MVQYGKKANKLSFDAAFMNSVPATETLCKALVLCTNIMILVVAVQI